MLNIKVPMNLSCNFSTDLNEHQIQPCEGLLSRCDKVHFSHLSFRKLWALGLLTISRAH